MVTILCVRFGKKYGKEYVERLRNMVARHCTVPYEFVCLTDDDRPIDGVRLIVQPNAGYQRGWWHKVHMFNPDLDVSERVLYFDLDTVIIENIDKLFDYTTEFVGIRDFNRQFHPNWNILNSSIMTWLHQSESDIWEKFAANPQAAQTLAGDQDWIYRVAKDRIIYYPRDWVMSYKWEIRSKEELVFINGVRKFKETKNPEIPKDCSVLVFHGDPKPEDVTDPIVVDNWR